MRRLRSAIRSDGEATAAVVVGGGLNALGVVRSLGRARVPVRLLAGDTAMPAVHSRYTRPMLYDDRSTTSIVEALVDMAEREPGSRRPLILTEEEKVAAVSAHRDALAPHYHLLLPSDETVKRLLHKDGFGRAAQAANCVTPRSIRVRATADIALLADLMPPLVVKPTGRQAAYLARFKRAYRVNDRAGAQGLLAEMLAVSDDLIVQEWIEGDDSAIYFCLQFVPDDDCPPVSFVGRKLRAWPPETGGTACCVGAPEAARRLIEPTTRFFRSQGVVGYASMEYKYRAANDEYVMIEPTIGRTDHQEEIATLNGTNIPLAGYRSALGQSAPAPATGVRARIWRDRDAEANAIAAKPRIAHPAPDARVVDALWRPDDPAPALYDVARRARTRMRRLRGRTR